MDDGQDYYTFYITDFNSPELLLTATTKVLINPKYNSYNVYIHNFSNFDAIFLFKYILNLSKEGYEVDFLKREDKFIKVNISKDLSKEEHFEISIYDSYLLLPNKLSILAKAFNVTGKLSFNVLNNDTADLNDRLFRTNLLTYNQQDCKVLYDVIVAFNNNFNDLFNMSIFNSPTLPSLAFKLWKSNFVNKDLFIPITWAEDYNDFKSGYKGGAVDVYRPHGHNLYYYDVNSLYPYSMKSNLFPTGEGWKITGNIWPLDKIFGLVYCKVTAPKDLYAPILLTKDSKGHTIAPIGSWVDWYVSEELKLAVSYGYQVEVLKAYHWENKSDLFSSYVNTLYNHRLTYPKSDPRNTISKLLLNSLYGKFGMSPVMMEYTLWKDNELPNNCDIQEVGDITLVGREVIKNQFLHYKLSKEYEQYYPLLDISTPIAIFTTAYSRMHMAKFKVAYANNLYYSDTDSLVLDCPLPNHMVGKELGQVKLEHTVTEGIFLGPKTYALRLDNGEYIIKVKGLKQAGDKVTFEQLKSLLYKNNILKIQQAKWFRSLDKSNIQILNSIYSLRATDNKRTFIYKNDLAVNTKPFVL